MKITPVQKQTRAGQRTRFKAFVVVGDSNGHAGLGVKCSKEVATAIRGAIILAKLSVIPVRRGYWGNKIGKPHTVPCKVTGKCGSVTVRMVPAPRGAGIVAARVPKKVLQMAGIDDVFTSSRGSTKTLGNFVKVDIMDLRSSELCLTMCYQLATFDCLLKTYGFLTPDFWGNTNFIKSPYQQHTDLLAKPTSKAITYHIPHSFKPKAVSGQRQPPLAAAQWLCKPNDEFLYAVSGTIQGGFNARVAEVLALRKALLWIQNILPTTGINFFGLQGGRVGNRRSIGLQQYCFGMSLVD
ncbi:hypothetical protein ACFE04_007831 [Oxalis oulophora]